MKTKKVCASELAYVIGILLLALGTAFMEKMDLGISMVVAPAYLLHLKISQFLPFFSFGMAEYVFQAFILIVLTILMRRFKISYLFSFVTAVLYGFSLDLAIFAVSGLPVFGIVGRLIFYALGFVLCSIGIAFLFHTYIPPEAYELFVKELAAKHDIEIPKLKTIYDCCSCLLGILLSFLFFGFLHFEGVKLGTIFCTLLNGWLIGKVSGVIENAFQFKDALPWCELLSR